MDPSVRATLMVTCDLTTRGYYNELYIFNTINNQLNSGYIQSETVTPTGFTFRSLSGNIAGGCGFRKGWGGEEGGGGGIGVLVAFNSLNGQLNETLI